MQFKNRNYSYFDDALDAAAVVAAEKEKNKTFTQTDVDKIIQDRLKKQKVEQDKLITQIQELQNNKNLTETEKAELQQQIDDFKSSIMTKEELASKKEKELADKHTKDIEKANKDITIWKDRYTNSTIERSLLDAAVENKAIRPQQLVDLLRNKTRLVEHDGNFIPQVKFIGKDKDNKDIEMDLPVKEAMTQIKSMVDNYGNLFISDANGGIGQNQNSGGSKSQDDLFDTASYIEARRKGLKLEQIQPG